MGARLLVLGTGGIDAVLAGDHLRGVAVDVHGVGAAVVVIDHDVVNSTLEQDERLRVLTVDDWIRGVFTSAQGGHECGNFLLKIGNVVEAGSVLAILFKEAKTEGNGLGRAWEKLLLVQGLESEVVNNVERGSVHRAW